jgi:predicted transglutaminase-like cysteine proteinase
MVINLKVILHRSNKVKILPVKFLFGLLCLFSILLSSSAMAVEYDDAFLNEIEKKYGDYAKRRLVSWQKLLKTDPNIPESEKLEKVNTFFNLIEFQSDLSHWNQVDYWATPLEFLVSGAGDCEDYSIAKYYTLIKLGVPDEKLLITYTKALEYNQAHMVLTYYENPGAIPLVLDNLNKMIFPATKRKDLKPIYSFNGSGLWRAKSRGLGKKLGKSDDVKRWVAMEERLTSGEISKFN